MLPHISLSDPTTHPRKTLDLGCGSGAWIISAASVWPQTRFVGFDLVPQITNLSVFEETSAPDSAATPCRRFSLTERRALKSSNPHGPCGGSTPTHRRLSERVRFVHGNFLINGLPFEDGEFDHVRIVGIARGVPEKKVRPDTPHRKVLSLIPSQWDYLLAEVHRVLCDGGHLEMIEEDIIFPILPRRIDAPAQRKFPDEDLDEAKLFYRRPTHVLHHSTSSIGSSSSNSALHMSKKEDDVSHSGMQSTSSRRTFVPSQPLSVPMLAQSPSAGTHSSNLSMNGSSRPLPATNKPSRMAAGKDKPLPPPPSFKGGAFNNSGSHPDTPTRASLAQPGQTSSHSGNTRRGTPKSQSMQPIRPASAHNPQRSGSNVQSMTPNFQSMQPIRPASAHSPPRSGPNVQSMAFSIIGRRPRSARESRPPKKESIVAAPPSTQPLPLKVPRSQSVEPVTRHEHAVLEILFKSVFEGRFINTSPTAILPSYLNVYFKNLKPSPRVDMPTPPAPERRIKDVFGTEDVNVVPLKPALEGPLQPAAAIANRYPAPQTYQRSRSLLRSASTLLRPTEQLRRPRDLSASSESEESDFTYWSARSLVTPITPLEESKGIEFVKGGEYPGENNKKTPSSTLLPMFDEEDDAREAITSPTSNWARLPPETGIVQEDEAPITLDAALAAIERHDHFYNEPLSASRWRSVDVGGLRSTYQRKPTRCAEKYACQSYTRVKARDSVGSVFCFVLPRALFKLDERDMGLHLRKTYMGEFQRFPPYPLRVRDSHSISRCHRLSRSHVGGTATSSRGCHWRTWGTLPNNVAGSCEVVVSGTLDERCGEI